MPTPSSRRLYLLSFMSLFWISPKHTLWKKKKKKDSTKTSGLFMSQVALGNEDHIELLSTHLLTKLWRTSLIIYMPSAYSFWSPRKTIILKTRIFVFYHRVLIGVIGSVGLWYLMLRSSCSPMSTCGIRSFALFRCALRQHSVSCRFSCRSRNTPSQLSSHSKIFMDFSNVPSPVLMFFRVRGPFILGYITLFADSLVPRSR